MASKFAGYNIPKEFLNNKQQTLGKIDLSKKGSIDALIIPLIDAINTFPFCYTTSSCSGRIIVYSEKEMGAKISCKWIFTSHNECTMYDVITALNREVTTESKVITLKFEPLIMHLCCANIECSKALMKVAVGCGFRNSGLSIGKKIILAVRSTQGLEVPIGRDGAVLVEEKYLKFLIEEANAKMKLNCERIKVLELAIINELANLTNVQVTEKEKIHQPLYNKENNKQSHNSKELEDEEDIFGDLFS